MPEQCPHPVHEQRVQRAEEEDGRRTCGGEGERAEQTATLRKMQEKMTASEGMMLWPIARRLEGSNIGLAAQNCHWAEKGAFTGELSPAQLREAGCSHAIIGHSERRQYFGETDEGVGQKARALHDHGLIPILCVGETLEEREAGKTLDIVLGQIKAGLSGVEIQITTHLSHPLLQFLLFLQHF